MEKGDNYVTDENGDSIERQKKLPFDINYFVILNAKYSYKAS